MNVCYAKISFEKCLLRARALLRFFAWELFTWLQRAVQRQSKVPTRSPNSGRRLRNFATRSGTSVWPGTVDPNSRNPFHVPDVPDPDGADVKRYAPTIKYLGKADDPNADPWVTTPTGSDRSSIDGIDGEWIGRWNTNGGRWVPSYKAQVKTVGGRVYIFYRDHQGRFLADLHREKDLLVGRLVGIDNPADSSLCVVRIVGPDRLDGVWDAGDGNPRRGRLDFRRRFN